MVKYNKSDYIFMILLTVEMFSLIKVYIAYIDLKNYLKMKKKTVK